MSLAARVYVAAWIAALLLAIVVAYRARLRPAIVDARYRRLLARPWRLGTFALAAASFMLLAPYTGDPTWDWVDGGVQSTLAFTTAPWTVGVLYRAIRRRPGTTKLHVYIALCLWMLSASWSYDGYLLLRDGHYAPSWLSNIPPSSGLYFAAGLFWSLTWRPGRGVVFAFMLDEWPSDEPADAPAWPMAAYALPFVGIVVLMFAWFLVQAR